MTCNTLVRRNEEGEEEKHVQSISSIGAGRIYRRCKTTMFEKTLLEVGDDKE